MISESKAQKMALVAKVIAGENRLRILALLDESTGNGHLWTVATLAKELGVSDQANFYDVRMLKDLRLIEAEKIGRHVYYRINRDKLPAGTIAEILALGSLPI